jgi:hypothetical protein
LSRLSVYRLLVSVIRVQTPFSVVCVQTLFSVVRVQTSLLRLALHIGVVRELAFLIRVQTSLLCLAPHIGVVCEFYPQSCYLVRNLKECVFGFDKRRLPRADVKPP